jgi:hypothetical protein
LEAIDVVVNSNEEYNDYDGNLLNLLVKFAPASLYKIHINCKYFTIISFFSNWGDRKTLHLYDHNSNWFELIKKKII